MSSGMEEEEGGEVLSVSQKKRCYHVYVVVASERLDYLTSFFFIAPCTRRRRLGTRTWKETDDDDVFLFLFLFFLFFFLLFFVRAIDCLRPEAWP